MAIQALAGVLGGIQSLHTNSMDETLALPTEQAVMVALRTQQVIAEETGVTNTIDPFGGSYAVEALTDRMEREANDYIRRIDEMGGMVKAIKTGYPQREIAEAAFHFQRQLEQGIKTVVGVNKYSYPRKFRSQPSRSMPRSRSGRFSACARSSANETPSPSGKRRSPASPRPAAPART